MNDSSNNQSSSASKVPSHVAYHARDRNGGDAIWTRIGSAWQHADGKGFNVQIDVVPHDGRLKLRLPAEKVG